MTLQDLPTWKLIEIIAAGVGVFIQLDNGNEYTIREVFEELAKRIDK